MVVAEGVIIGVVLVVLVVVPVVMAHFLQRQLPMPTVATVVIPALKVVMEVRGAAAVGAVRIYLRLLVAVVVLQVAALVQVGKTVVKHQVSGLAAMVVMVT